MSDARGVRASGAVRVCEAVDARGDHESRDVVSPRGVRTTARGVPIACLNASDVHSVLAFSGGALSSRDPNPDPPAR